jgi:hypothetical protein
MEIADNFIRMANIAAMLGGGGTHGRKEDPNIRGMDRAEGRSGVYGL